MFAITSWKDANAFQEHLLIVKSTWQTLLDHNPPDNDGSTGMIGSFRSTLRCDVARGIAPTDAVKDSKKICAAVHEKEQKAWIDLCHAYTRFYAVIMLFAHGLDTNDICDPAISVFSKASRSTMPKLFRNWPIGLLSQMAGAISSEISSRPAETPVTIASSGTSEAYSVASSATNFSVH